MKDEMGQESNEWVRCMERDEIIDNEVVTENQELKAGEENDKNGAWRLTS